MPDPTRSLSGKVVLVTGASSGIGEATAEALADAGASIAIGARRADRLDALASRLRKGDTKVATLDLDVTDEQACHAAVEQTRSSLGAPDVLVNCAGLMLLGPIVGADTEDWRRMMSTNVLGLMYMTHAVIGDMVERGSGHIVNISSVAGRVARSGAGAYNASKWAVNAFSESLRQEVTAKGVRITMIEPGAVETELNDHITDADSKKTSEETYASMDSLHAEDIAAAILYVLRQPSRVAVNEILVRPTDQVQP
jgi:NADP-dependent 3-hydroxy acid dehydrogenase YdfG